MVIIVSKTVTAIMTLENEAFWIPREHSTVSRLFDNKPLVAKQFKTMLTYYYKTRKHES